MTERATCETCRWFGRRQAPDGVIIYGAKTENGLCFRPVQRSWLRGQAPANVVTLKWWTCGEHQPREVRDE